jgi:hypothetical protein
MTLEERIQNQLGSLVFQLLAGQQEIEELRVRVQTLSAPMDKSEKNGAGLPLTPKRG